MIKLILAAVLAAENPISIVEIRSILFQKTKKDTAKSTIQLYLTDLMNKGKVIRKKAKKTQHTSYGSGNSHFYLYEAA